MEDRISIVSEYYRESNVKQELSVLFKVRDNLLAYYKSENISDSELKKEIVSLLNSIEKEILRRKILLKFFHLREPAKKIKILGEKALLIEFLSSRFFTLEGNNNRDRLSFYKNELFSSEDLRDRLVKLKLTYEALAREASL